MLLPLSDENEDYDVPVTNRLIFFVCIAVFIYECFLSEKQLDGFIAAFGFNPHDFIKGAHGWAKFKGALQAAFDLRHTGWITAVTALFIHGGVMHIAGNLFFLWIFGDNVEHAMGRLRYFAFFILTGMLANFTQAWFGTDADIPCIGASGAISAVMGAYLVFYPRAIINVCIYWSLEYDPYISRMPAWRYLFIYFAMQLATGLLTWGDKFFEVAVWAHIGGFVFGAALAKVFKDPFMLFKEEGEKLFGLGKHGNSDEEYHEYVMSIGRRAGWSGDVDFGPGKKIHRRPPLKEMREKGRKERAETKKKRGW